MEVALGLNDSSSETWYTLATIYAENYLLVDALIALEKALIINKELQKKAINEESFFTLRDSELFNYMIYSQ